MTEIPDPGTPPIGSDLGATSDRPSPETTPLDVPLLTVSLAVHLVDGATGGAPVEVPDVSLELPGIPPEDVDTEPRRKADRFVLFLDVDLPDPPTPAVVSVDGGDRYRDVTHQVVVTDETDPAVPAEVEVYPPSDPVVTTWLFAPDATVLRGYVRDAGGDRLTAGELRVTDLGFDLTATIDRNGRFVLGFEEAPADGDVGVELDVDELGAPVAVSLPVVEGSETVRTLVVDVDAGTVTVEADII